MIGRNGKVGNGKVDIQISRETGRIEDGSQRKVNSGGRIWFSSTFLGSWLRNHMMYDTITGLISSISDRSGR